MKLLTPDEETASDTARCCISLPPAIVDHDGTVMGPCERALEEYMATLEVDLNCVNLPQQNTSIDAVDQWKD